MTLSQVLIRSPTPILIECLSLTVKMYLLLRLVTAKEKTRSTSGPEKRREFGLSTSGSRYIYLALLGAFRIHWYTTADTSAIHFTL